ncbi:hypothetical protein KKG16_01530 [Patescibacteria group bacterium]|nr:hypothetical protein [Patescibacteria group bacterium]
MVQTTCTQCGSSFEITEDDLTFYEQVSPVFPSTTIRTGNDKKYLIPPPKCCPDCRQQRRLAMCNEQNLYNSSCDLCKKEMISQFQPNQTFPVYCRDCWHSDKWDTLSYGRDYDFSKPFFEQFA